MGDWKLGKFYKYEKNSENCKEGQNFQKTETEPFSLPSPDFGLSLPPAISPSTDLRSTWFQKNFHSPWSQLTLPRRHQSEKRTVEGARRPRSCTARAGIRRCCSSFTGRYLPHPATYGHEIDINLFALKPAFHSYMFCILSFTIDNESKQRRSDHFSCISSNSGQLRQK
jgi:hypothetical protein